MLLVFFESTNECLKLLVFSHVIISYQTKYKEDTPYMSEELC